MKYKRCVSQQNLFWPFFKIRLTNSISFNESWQVNPTLSIGPVVGRLHWFCILIHFWLDLIYSPPTSSCIWHHPVGQIQSVYFSSQLWFDLAYSLSNSSCPWHHLDILQPLKLHPRIFSRQNIPWNHLVFVCRSLIIWLENISSVSTNCNRVSF